MHNQILQERNVLPWNSQLVSLAFMQSLVRCDVVMLLD